MVVLVALSVISSCGSGIRAEGRLRTVESKSGTAPVLCTPARMLPFRIAINIFEPDPVSGTWVSDGVSFHIVWPPGFRLSTASRPAVLDPSGTVVARDGQILEDAGGSGGDPVTVCSIGGHVYPMVP